MVKQVSLKIYGRVQGVFFRDTARRKARKLDLTGWVQNQSDGAVKIVAQGQEDNLKKFIDWCYNGSILAKVNKVEINWRELEEKSNDFRIRY